MVLAWLESTFENWIVNPLASVFFLDLAFWTDAYSVPMVVAWLVTWSFLFTLRFKFVNVRVFCHAVDCVRGKYTDPSESGEISHFQALTAALSATVGLGNIAGVSVAVQTGGPGAVFWMVVAGSLGMTSKFAECTLGQKFKVTREDGQICGGPMYYLSKGLEDLGIPTLGKLLSVVFTFMCMGGSFGGGNMFQANQAYAQMELVFPALASNGGSMIFGLVLAVLVGVVIIGGVKSIANVASAIVPFMCFIYVGSGLLVLILNAGSLGSSLGIILGQAFNPKAQFGGLVGVLATGFQRAAFSNEAGTGSASIMHSAAKTDEPIREGLVALLEPFIDTLIVCTMTGLVLVVTGAYDNPDAGQGIQMTSWAFASVFPWYPPVLSFVSLLFAFSTMISWSYYGEQCWVWMFGTKFLLAYKILFCVVVWLGCNLEATAVITFSDLMILGMSFPNLLGVALLSGKIAYDLNSYLTRLYAGELPRYD